MSMADQKMVLTLVGEDSLVARCDEVAGRPCWSSLKSTDPADRVRILNLTIAHDHDVGECLGSEIDVRDICVFPDTAIDPRTGEIHEVVRTILVSPRGESFGTTSEWIYDSLRQLSSVFGFPPWNPPLKVTVCHRTTRNKRTMHFLQLVLPAPAEEEAEEEGNGHVR